MYLTPNKAPLGYVGVGDMLCITGGCLETLRRRIRAGRLKPPTRVKKKLYWKVEDVKAYLDAEEAKKATKEEAPRNA